jgi:hypothetical protein
METKIDYVNTITISPFLRQPTLVEKWSNHLKDSYKPKTILKQIFRFPSWYNKNTHADLIIPTPADFIVRPARHKHFCTK